jgi:hypothetical protein
MSGISAYLYGTNTAKAESNKDDENLQDPSQEVPEEQKVEGDPGEEGHG